MPKDALECLWESTSRLHERFYPNGYPTFEAQHKVFVEEMGEFIFAISNNSSSEACAEAVDMLVTAIGLLQGFAVTLEQFQSYMKAIAVKNDAKTLETHEVRPDGKIARRGNGK